MKDKTILPILKNVFEDMIKLSDSVDDGSISKFLADDTLKRSHSILLTDTGILASKESITNTIINDQKILSFFINLTSALIMRLALKHHALNIDDQIDSFTSYLSKNQLCKTYEIKKTKDNIFTRFLDRIFNRKRISDSGKVIGDGFEENLYIDADGLNIFFKENKWVFIYVIFYVERNYLLDKRSMY